MAVVNFNKKKFETEIGSLNEKMQEKIALFGTPIEAIKEEEVELDIAPNRPDLLSYGGFKRGFLGFLGKKTGLIDYKLEKPEKNFQVIVDGSVKNIRPFTACAIIRNLELDHYKIKEIIEIQEKLHSTLGRKRKKVAIGIYPFDKIKFPITFKAIEPDKIKFQPLETIREMSGLEILQKTNAGREYAHLLAGKEKFPIFIDAEGKILSMPPIINSQITGKVSEETKEIFVECSGFDFETLSKCLNILVTSFAEMGGKIYQMEIKYSKKIITPNLTPEKMKISIEATNKLLGIELKEKQIKELLEKMGYSYNNKNVLIPAWRTDILHEVDLIEDIAIAYGYENFKPVIPNFSTMGQEDAKQSIKRKIAEALIGLGMLEVSNYHLTNKNDQFLTMGISDRQIKNFIEVEQSKTEYNILRKDLTHYLLKNLSENVDVEYPQKIFEIGKIFDGLSEKENLAIAITPGNFTELKQAIFYLFGMIGEKIEISESEKNPDWFIEGRVIEIKQQGKKIGWLGEIHPKILKNWKIKMPIALLEINIETLYPK